MQQKAGAPVSWQLFLAEVFKAHQNQMLVWQTNSGGHMSINLCAWDYMAVRCEEDLKWLEKGSLHVKCDIFETMGRGTEHIHTGEEFARSDHIRRQRCDV